MFPLAFSRRAVPAALAMPLRAHFKSHTQQGWLRRLDAAEKVFKQKPEDAEEDVVFHTLFGLRTMELNRPDKLNALDGSMIRKVGARVLEFQKSDMANVLVIKGAGDRAFCAGGDVMQLALWNQEGPEGQQRSTDFFALEYRLNHLIATCRKPFLAFMDGITMGGGVGLSAHAHIRIATERTVWAMPETTIGFFPDVGATFFLPRLPGAVGRYLALTSERLTGANAFYAGVATHYLHSTSLPALESRLAELRFKDHDDMATRLGLINATVEEFCTGLPHDEPILLAGRLRVAIDRCFGGHSRMSSILAALEAEKAAAEAAHEAAVQAAVTQTERESVGKGALAIAEWAKRTMDTLRKRSPTSLHVTLAAMGSGPNLDIASAFKQEHKMAAQFMQHPDFVEGVTAQLGKPRRNPQWSPATLEEAYDGGSREALQPFFGPSQLELLTLDTFNEYPAKLGLPTDDDVRKLLGGGGDKKWTRASVLEHFRETTRGKQGVAEAVDEILKRATKKVNDKGKLHWRYRAQLSPGPAAENAERHRAHQAERWDQRRADLAAAGEAVGEGENPHREG